MTFMYNFGWIKRTLASTLPYNARVLKGIQRVTIAESFLIAQIPKQDKQACAG